MKYWQIDGGTALELANERRHNEQEQKKDTGVYGRGARIQAVYEAPCIKESTPVPATF